MADFESIVKGFLDASVPSESVPKGPLPVNFGIAIFPGFQALDAFGSLDALNTLATFFPINFSVLAATLDPVSTKAQVSFPLKSDCGQSINPTHTFDTAPDLDVLLVPGGLGVIAPTSQAAVDFVKKVYPSLKYLFTVCNGAVIAARAGVLEGKKATTNKMGWTLIREQHPGVKWVAHARWAVDGNIWTTSGVSAGLDGFFALIKEVYGGEAAERIANILEYERHMDPSWDPYAKLLNLPKD